MRKIYKYKLDQVYRQLVPLPKGAKILKVDLQFGQIVMWAHVDPIYQSENRIIYTVPTGEGVEGEYLGTLKFQDGAFILHIFEGIV